MKRGGWIALAVVAVVVLFVANQLVGNYNRLVGADQGVKQRWAQVDNQLQRRNDLIGNLVETVKGTATQEQTVFGEIADARAKMAGARTPAEGITAGQALARAWGVKKGLTRYGQSHALPDEALSRAVIDLSRWPGLELNVLFLRAMIGILDVTLVHEFLQGTVNHAG